MEALQNLVQGFAFSFDPDCYLMAAFGTFLGIVIGALPGLTATTGVSIFLPLTFYMQPVPAFGFLLGIYCGGTYGGSITAILINTPGTPSAAATAIEGYEMSKKGEALKALEMALYASFVGGIISCFCLIFVSPILASFAMNFGPAEYFVLGVFGISIVASLAAGNMVKGLISACFGLTLSVIGLDPIDGATRLTFGTISMQSGITTIPALIALFAVGELMIQGEDIYKPKNLEIQKISGGHLKLNEFFKHWKIMGISSLIGCFIGAVPGTGGGIAAFCSYNTAQKMSKDKKAFGTGTIEGIAASEAGNNGVTGATMIPLLTLGIPGDAVTAVLLGALMIQGLTPGPLLFEGEEAKTIYGIFALLIICNIFMLVLGKLGLPLFSKVTEIPAEILQPIVLALCCIGTYASSTRVYELRVMIVIGVVAFLMKKLNLPTAPALLALILGPTVEAYLRRGLVAKRGDFIAMFAGRPIAITIAVITILMLLYSAYGEIKGKKNIEES